MDFKALLEPYKQGGTESSPVTRTMGTIVDYLINRRYYPIDVVGSAIFEVFFWLDAGNKFEGNEKYGSKGEELISSIRIKCDELLHKKLTGVTMENFVNYSFKRDLRRWWRGRD